MLNNQTQESYEGTCIAQETGGRWVQQKRNLEKCIFCLITLNSKLFVLTSKQNKEPYFAIKLTKNPDGTWYTGSSSFLGFQNRGLGSPEFVFPPELRDLPSIDKNAEMIRDFPVNKPMKFNKQSMIKLANHKIFSNFG